jgi:tyrosyl-tRNA synthetase
MKNKNLKIKEILTRWVDKIYPSKEAFLKALKSKKMVIYHGIDPTASHLHLGHSTNFFLLREFQKLGHKIIILIGDFTAQIGDPTGKDVARKPLSKEEVKKNCKTYKKQIAKILDFKSKENPVKIKFNSQWLNKLKMEELIKLAAKFTQAFMIKRSMFQKRLKEKKEIYLHEFLYPLFQGYDSLALNVDGEVGGTDQTFNMLVGRDLMKIYKKKEKFVITTPLLINPKTGKKLMSKSEGNFIALDDPPNQMYGKIMALSDQVIISCFKLCTKVPLVEIKKMEKNLKLKKVNPRDLKTKLAKEIVAIYYGEKSAQKAKKEFERIFREKKLPSKIPSFKFQAPSFKLLDLLVKTKLASSKSEAKRLILQGGVKIIQKTEKEQKTEILKDWQKEIKIKPETIIQVGKRKFAKINPA